MADCTTSPARMAARRIWPSSAASLRILKLSTLPRVSTHRRLAPEALRRLSSCPTVTCADRTPSRYLESLRTGRRIQEVSVSAGGCGLQTFLRGLLHKSAVVIR